MSTTKRGTCKCYHRWPEHKIGHHCWGCDFDIVPAHDLHFVIIDYSATRYEDRVKWVVDGKEFSYLSQAAEYLTSKTI